MITEEELLKLLKVQSNLSPKDFELLYGERGRCLFTIFAHNSWNLISFLFDKVNEEEREKMINYVNEKIVEVEKL